MSTKVILHFSGSDPSEKDRRELGEAHQAYWDAREGGSNDAEIVAASNFIEALMNYAGIGGEEAEGRECSHCGDEVQYLNSDDECDACAAQPQCDECDTREGDADHQGHAIQLNRWPALVPPVQMCPSCTHNAYRSGWEPGA